MSLDGRWSLPRRTLRTLLTGALKTTRASEWPESVSPLPGSPDPSPGSPWKGRRSQVVGAGTCPPCPASLQSLPGVNWLPRGDRVGGLGTGHSPGFPDSFFQAQGAETVLTPAVPCLLDGPRARHWPAGHAHSPQQGPRLGALPVGLCSPWETTSGWTSASAWTPCFLEPSPCPFI